MEVLELGKRIRSNLGEVLERKGIMKKWIAEQTGATQAQVNRWCKNKDGVAESTPSVYYILQLEELLNTPVGEMFEVIKED